MNVLMPQFGETVAEGKVAAWLKSVGDSVEPGDNLFEIETDKVTMEVQATEGGVLSEIRVDVGEIAKVGAVIAVIGKAGNGAARSPATPATTQAHAHPAAIPSLSTPVPASEPIALDPHFEVRTPTKNYGPAKMNGRAITPLARRLASDAGIDMARIDGTGPRGRIVAADVRAASRLAPVVGGSALPASPGADEIIARYKDRPFEQIPLDGMRKTIADRLQHAKQTVPHFYLVDDIAVDALVRLRTEINAAAPIGPDEHPLFRISLNDFIVKAWALALQSVPAANAAWAGDRILRFARSDVAVAVAVDGGLLTPVVRDAEEKSIKAIATELRDLTSRARERKLMPEEYQGGASSVSNLGMYGVREFSAIINPPHGTILAVGAMRRQAVEQEDGSAAFASMMTVTLSCDHRVVDGALGADLLKAFKRLMQAPMSILV